MKILLFISLPMRGKTDEEIKARQKELYKAYRKKYPDREIQLINKFKGKPDQMTMQDMLGHAEVELLGESISLMSYADVVLFDNGWENYPGCRIEHKVCTYYNLPIEYAR